MNLKQYLAKRAQKVEEALQGYIPKLSPEVEELASAMSYSLLLAARD